MNKIKAYYTEPDAHEPCMFCEYQEYDSFHDEKWSGHNPSQDGLNNRLLINKWGHCEYFKREK